MAKYLLLLRDDGTTFPGLSPEAMQAAMQRYIDWTRGLAARGLLVDASKLADGAGRVVSGTPGRTTVTDGPYIEGKELVGGFYIVQAASFDEAASLAGDCPHLDFGSIEIRELEATGGEHA